MSTSPGRSTLRDDLALLHHRPYLTLLVARTISVLGSAFAPVALAFGVLHLPGATASTLSIVLACESVPMVVLLLLGGVVADRLPRGRLVMSADLLSCCAFGGLGLMIGTGYAPLPLMGVSSAASGIGMALLWPALTGLVPEVVPAAQLQAGNALLSMTVNAARIFGVVAGGFVVALLGAPWALAVAAALFAAAAAVIVPLRPDAGTGPAGHSSSMGVGQTLRDLAEGWREFASRQWLWVVVAQSSVLMLVFSAAHGVFGPVIANAELGGARAWSWVLAGESVGMLVGVVLAMRVRPRRPILLAVVVNIPTVPLPWLLLAVHAPLWSVVVGSFCMGTAFDFFGVLWQTTVQREVPPESLSRVSSYDAMGSLMFGPIGLLLAGPAATLLGVHRAMGWCAAVLFVVSIAGALSPGVRGLVWDAADPAPSLPVLPEPPLT